MECLGTITKSGTRFTYYKDEKGGIWFDDEPIGGKPEWMQRAAVTLLVCLISNHSQNEKTRALMEYKLEELTKRVDKHNNVVERTYSLEQKAVVQEEQIKVANHRISDLEEKENGHV